RCVTQTRVYIAPRSIEEVDRVDFSHLLQLIQSIIRRNGHRRLTGIGIVDDDGCSLIFDLIGGLIAISVASLIIDHKIIREGNRIDRDNISSIDIEISHCKGGERRTSKL